MLFEAGNKEVKRRARVVGVFLERLSVIRLVGSILNEIDDDGVFATTLLGPVPVDCLYGSIVEQSLVV